MWAPARQGRRGPAALPVVVAPRCPRRAPGGLVRPAVPTPPGCSRKGPLPFLAEPPPVTETIDVRTGLQKLLLSQHS